MVRRDIQIIGIVLAAACSVCPALAQDAAPPPVMPTGVSPAIPNRLEDEQPGEVVADPWDVGAPAVEAAPEAEPAALPLPMPGDLPIPDQEAEAAPRDEQVRPVQEPGVLMPGPESSAEAPNPPPGAAGETGAGPLPADRLALGPQALGLTVEVQSPPEFNLNLPYTMRVIVKNSGQVDALGVMVYDLLPEGLEFLDGSPPEPQHNGRLLVWKLDVVAAGSSHELKFQVKPVQVGQFDHAATVALMTGGKSRTLIKQPKLRVEQAVVPPRLLKGQKVQFQITVSNPGTGAARDVVVRAKLSPGLRHEEGLHIEQTLKSLGPGQTISLDPIIADAVQGGTQSCEVSVISPDVVPTTPEATSTQTVEVTEPGLELAIAGPSERYTNTRAKYQVTVSNPGTAPALGAVLSLALPKGGRPLYAVPKAGYNALERTLSWTIPRLEPKKDETFEFEVQLGGSPLLYRIAAEARARGSLVASKTFSTDVQGVAVVDFDVAGRHRFLDESQETVFDITIRNFGTKEASRLQVSAQLSNNLKAQESGGTSEKAKVDEAETFVLFPEIDRLAPGAEITLGIKVKAVGPGPASCRVYLAHSELQAKIDHSAFITITGSSPPQP